MIGPKPYSAPNFTKKVVLPKIVKKPENIVKTNKPFLQQGDGSNLTSEPVAPFGLSAIVQGSKPIISKEQAAQTVNNTPVKMPKPAQLPATGAGKIDKTVLGQLGGNFLAGDDINTIRQKFPELEGITDTVLGQLGGNFLAGDDIDTIIKKYPELGLQAKESRIIPNIGAGVGQSLTNAVAGFGEIGKSLATSIPTSVINAGRKALGKKQMYKVIEGEKVLVNPDGSVAETAPNIWEKAQGQLKGYGENMGADTESVAFQAGKVGTDIAQLITPTGGTTKIGSAIAGSEKAQKVLKGLKVLDSAGDITTFGKIAKAGLVGAKDTQKAGVISGEGLASVKGTALGALMGGSLEGVGQLASNVASKAAKKLQISGLLNPKKLEYVQNALREEGDQIDNVTKWMSDRNLVGSKEKILTKLDDEAKKTYTAVRSAVKQADDIVPPIKDVSVGGALEELLSTVEGSKSPQKKAVYDELVGLLEKNNTVGLKPSEIQGVKDKMDDLLSIYTIAGDAKAGVKKADLADLRGNIRKLIEETVGKSTGADISSLNKNTAVARKLAEGIRIKDNAENVRDILSPFAPMFLGGAVGAGYGSAKGEDPRTTTILSIIGGAVGGSTTAKTYAAKALRNIAKPKDIYEVAKRVTAAKTPSLVNNNQ